MSRSRPSRHGRRLPRAWLELYDLVRPQWLKLALGLVVAMVQVACAFVLPFSAKILIDDIVGKHRHAELLPLVALIAATTVLQCLASLGIWRLLANPAVKYTCAMREAVHRRVISAPLDYYDRTASGRVASHVMKDVESVRTLLGGQLAQFLGGALTTLLVLVVLIRVSWPIALLVCAFSLIYAFFSWKAMRRVRPLLQSRQLIYAGINARLIESFRRIRIVKAYHGETQELAAFSQWMRELLENMLVSMKVACIPSLGATLCIGFIGAGLWFIGATQIFAGQLTPGDLMMFVVFVAVLINPISDFVGIGTLIAEIVGGMDEASKTLELPREDADPRRTVPLSRIEGAVVFDRVRYSYDGIRQAIHGISFVAPAGTVTALVGPSGAGKSTIINLIAALYNPTDGRITVDGVDLSSVRLDTYRTQLGIVLQEDFLFSGTIAENVAYAHPTATQEQIIEACKAAYVDEFAEKLERKYATPVGEDGIQLSRGQRQRIAIARALLARPRIFILDEPTSTLDAESERYVQDSLRRLMKGCTSFVIAHRLATVRDADQILFVENGSIVESGTHASLLKQRKRYWALHGLQSTIEKDLLPQADFAPEVAPRTTERALSGAESVLRQAETNALGRSYR